MPAELRLKIWENFWSDRNQLLGTAKQNPNIRFLKDGSLCLDTSQAILAFGRALKDELALFSDFFPPQAPPSTLIAAFPGVEQLYVELDRTSSATNMPVSYILAHIVFKSLSIQSHSDDDFLIAAMRWPELPSIRSLSIHFSEEEQDDEDDEEQEAEVGEEEEQEAEVGEEEEKRRRALKAERRAAWISLREEQETVPWVGEDADLWGSIMDRFPMLSELKVDFYRRVKPSRHMPLCLSTVAHCQNLQVVWIYCFIPNCYVMSGGFWGGRFRYNRSGEEWTLEVCERAGFGRSGWQELHRSDHYWYSAHR